MTEPSLISKRVEYQVSIAGYGVGVVMEHHQVTGRIVLIDEDDGTRWRGYDEHVTLIED